MPSALDTARAAAAEKEARLEAADQDVITALVEPTQALATKFAEAGMKVRSRKARAAMDRAVNAMRTALGALEPDV